MPSEAFLRSELPGLPVRRGKVRDLYDAGTALLLVATDRISAFDWVLPNGVPDKGRVLTRLSRFWFELLAQQTGVDHHLVTTDLDQMDLPGGVATDALRGRTTLCRKARVIPFECVARGYLAGSGWKEYRDSGAVCGVRLPRGLAEGSRLPEPIFTPATKAAQGEHDENVSYDHMLRSIGPQLAEQLRDLTLRLYACGARHAEERGVLIADTKFEFGIPEDGADPILIDEALTPDSSRFWPADQYRAGGAQPSFDKQYVRDWLLASEWDRSSPPPPLPEEVVLRTREKYLEAYERLTGEPFE